jgi:hypothetical protein
MCVRILRCAEGEKKKITNEQCSASPIAGDGGQSIPSRQAPISPLWGLVVGCRAVIHNDQQDPRAVKLST